MSNTIVFYVEDLTKSRAFYNALLQCAPIESSENFAMYSLSEQLMVGLWHRSQVTPPAESATGAQGEVCLFVPDHPRLQHMYDHCRAIGISIIQEPIEMDFGRTFTICDPDGCRIRYATPV